MSLPTKAKSSVAFFFFRAANGAVNGVILIAFQCQSNTLFIENFSFNLGVTCYRLQFCFSLKSINSFSTSVCSRKWRAVSWWDLWLRSKLAAFCTGAAPTLTEKGSTKCANAGQCSLALQDWLEGLPYHICALFSSDVLSRRSKGRSLKRRIITFISFYLLSLFYRRLI